MNTTSRARNLSRAAIAALTAVALAGCGNVITTRVAGQTGLNVNSDGDIIAHIQACDIPVDRIFISLKELSPDGQWVPNDEENSWEISSATAHTGYFTVNLTHPDAEWDNPTGRILEVQDDKRYGIGVFSSAEDAEVKGLSILTNTLTSPDDNSVAVSLFGGQSAEDVHQETPNDYGEVGLITLEQLKGTCTPASAH
ncbi:hypothetical protein [Corynebacterium aquilae]|uniref:Uncharacterized protein n=1 Tax=Corynebacterium aquilae DSM 44791 TaxID=1431546 RepID=A0A1L7CDE1_9CORY|nr:hypothetical protein [Corynebacterium aquilae]APT83823.1 hypothetical protein CAQU_00550 [Corynebacterium aquilae DSM 44791]